MQLPGKYYTDQCQDTPAQQYTAACIHHNILNSTHMVVVKQKPFTFKGPQRPFLITLRRAR